MYTYKSLKVLFETVKNKENGKPLGNNTRLFQRGKNFAIRLHNTDVVTITPKNIYILNTGGWKTITTKDRINKYAPTRIASVKGTWNIFNNGVVASLYYDGIKLNENGEVVSKIVDNSKKIKETKDLKARIKKYVKGYTDLIATETLDKPSTADCFYCRNAFNNSSDVSHLEMHIEENYFVPSLLVRAIENSGANPGFWFHMIIGNADRKPETSAATRFLNKYLVKKLVK